MNEIDLTKENLKRIISDDLGLLINREDITDDISLYDDGLGMDSITIVNFIIEIEKQFGITIEEDEMSASLFENVNSLASYIVEKQKLNEPLK
ncbi:acyl carrier protein [Olivibacter sp. CPCC 100613]|uniref:acyl carrier protein n=1 Tax=Olivibacter sp. CPCC 100613 TaxID=3079931 RepID=UPI002FFD0291